MRQIFMGSASANLTLTTSYGPIVGHNSWTGTRSNTWQLIAMAGTFRNLYIELDTAPGAGTSRVFTVWKDNAATAMTFTISDTETIGSYTPDLSWAADEMISIRMSVVGSPAASKARNSIEFEGDSALQAIGIGGGGGTTLDPSAVEYLGPGYGEQQAGPQGTEEPRVLINPLDATLDEAHFRLNAALTGGGESYTFQHRTDGADDSGVVVVLNGSEQIDTITGIGLDMVPGEESSWSVTPAGTPAAQKVQFGIIYTPDIPGESIIAGGTTNDTDSATTEYMWLMGAHQASWSSTFEVRQVSAITDWIARGLRVKLDVAPGASPNAVAFTLMNNTTALTNTVSVSGASTFTAVDTTNEDLITYGMQPRLRTTPTSSPTVGGNDPLWAMIMFIPPDGLTLHDAAATWDAISAPATYTPTTGATILIAIVGTEEIGSGPNAATMSSDVDGALTEAVQHFGGTANENRVGIFYLLDPTTGSAHTISASWASGTPDDVTISVFTLTGTVHATPVGSTGTYGVLSGLGYSIGSLSYTPEDFGVAGGVQGGNNTNDWWDVPDTEWVERIDVGDNSSVHSVQTRDYASSGTDTVTASGTTGSQRVGGVAAIFQGAGSGFSATGPVAYPMALATASGLLKFLATGDVAYPMATALASGTVANPVTGTGIVAYPMAGVSGTGVLLFTATGPVLYPMAQVSAAGTLTFTGAGGVAYPIVEVTGEGTQVPHMIATGAVAYPMAIADGQGGFRIVYVAQVIEQEGIVQTLIEGQTGATEGAVGMVTEQVGSVETFIEGIAGVTDGRVSAIIESNGSVEVLIAGA